MILITGAATRIGAAIARRLASETSFPPGLCRTNGQAQPRKRESMDPRFHGDDGIIVHYHSSNAAAEKLKIELEAAGAKVMLWQQDLRADDLAEQFKKLIAETGSIDTLINNAAVFYPDKDRLGDITPEFWHEVMQINCHAPFVLMQEFAAQNIKNGNIINILDQRVLNISHAFPVYTASKSALWALTQNMARALAPNIRVNAIAPGHVLPSAGEDENKFRARQAKTPLGIGPAPEEIAETIQLILESPSMTGACIPLDGGEHLIQKIKI